MNSTYSEYVITDDDHSYESRKIKDYMNSLSERFTTAIDASAIKIIVKRWHHTNSIAIVSYISNTPPNPRSARN